MASVARFCCCGFTCPASIDLTLAGVDASVCCSTNGSQSSTASPVAIDGVYNFVKNSEDINQCIYTGSNGSLTGVSYGNATCTGSGTVGFARTPSFTITYSKSFALWRVDSTAANLFANGAFPPVRVYLSGGFVMELGVAYPNSEGCAYHSTATGGCVTPGGTATLSLP